MPRIELDVPDISCDHCKRAIIGALRGQPGIEMVRVDVAEKQVTVDYDETLIDVAEIETLLDDEGYPVQSMMPVAM